MNLKRLRCLLFIMAFSMPALAAVPGPIDSFDDINDTNWVESTSVNYGDYMEQEVNDMNFVNEGAGSMKIDFTEYVWPVYDEEVFRTFSPALDFNDGNDWAITLWVWIKDANDSRRGALGAGTGYDSRLMGISLRDGSIFGPDPNRVGDFTVQPFKNDGWNKVIAPLRNFKWVEGSGPPIPIDPNEVDWNDIKRIGLWARTEDPGAPTYADNNAIYIDDMQLELAPPQPAKPYQVASCDDINDELWDERRYGNNVIMFQSPPGDPCMEGDSSMMVDLSLWSELRPDVCPTFTFIPALDFTDGNDWAITVWVWSDLIGDTELHHMILHDVGDHIGRYRAPRPSTAGWNKVTARIDEFLWQDGLDADIPTHSADEVNLDAILFLEMWTRAYPDTYPSAPGTAGNAIYMDDLRIEPAVEALSNAVVYNADYGTINVDGNPADWASLVDSDIIDFDLEAVPNQPRGNLHVKYRLAWDYTYLYILVEEQGNGIDEGDLLATEAAEQADFILADMDTMYDSLSLWFSFTNTSQAEVEMQISLWLTLGLSSTNRTDLIMAWTNSTWYDHQTAAIDDVANDVRTSGTLGSRVIEARLKWATLDGHLNSWFQPAGGLAAAVQPGYLFGCDPRLHDREDLETRVWTAEHGGAWLTGWMWDDYYPEDFPPTGRDIYSTDIRLVCSAGDLDFDCDVDFVDYAQFAVEWDETGCNNLNDFCNGADVVTPMNGDVDLKDLGRFALRWLSP